MKGRILSTIVFACLIYFGMGQLNALEPPPPAAQLLMPVQAECALPASMQPLHALPVPAPLPHSIHAPQPQASASCSAPVLLTCYYRTAYQAFHFSDCAG